MKYNLNKLLLAIVGLLLSSTALAHDFEVNGIYYNYLDKSAKTVAVTYKGSYHDSYDHEYTGAVSIPSSVTYNGTTYSVTEIGNHVFLGCSGLTAVTIPNTITKIGHGAFNKCFHMTSITIPNSVTEIGMGAFYGCYGLTSVTIPNSVTKIDAGAFYCCSDLTEVTIPNSVTEIGSEAFNNCSKIRSLTIGSGISSIPSNAFSVKPKKTIWLTNTPPRGYEYAAGVVNYVANNQYSSLSNVKVYPYLSSIFEVDGVKYVPVNPSERTCDAIDCAYNSNATDININNTVSYKGVAMTVKNINPYTCYGNNFIKSCTINFNGNIEEYTFNYCKNLESIDLSVNRIGNNAFYGCSSVNSITLSNKLKTIGNSAFYECNNLNAIVIPNSVTSLGESAFYNCSSLTSATIGNAVEKINSSTFYNCSSLKNITIGDGAKSIGNNAFHGCKSLFAIQIPKNVTSIGNSAFEKCSNLSDVIIKDRITVLTLGSNNSKPMFSDCPLDSVYIGGDISYKKTSDYGYSPFYNNKTLRAVTISNKETEISENEFYGCANLKSVSIGDGIMSIGNYAFSGCSSLKSFAFGSRLKTIGKEAFSDCTALTKLSSKAIIPPVCGQQALDDINKWECELYVPDNAVSAYKGANQWKEFFFINPNK